MEVSFVAMLPSNIANTGTNLDTVKISCYNVYSVKINVGGV